MSAAIAPARDVQQRGGIAWKDLRNHVRKDHVVLERDIALPEPHAELFPKDAPATWRAFAIRVRQPEIPLPGARVDVIVVAKDRSRTVVWEDVEVLPIGSGRGNVASEYQVMTLLATVEDVKRFAAQYPEDGYCMVAIRNPRDKAKAPEPPKQP